MFRFTAATTVTVLYWHDMGLGAGPCLANKTLPFFPSPLGLVISRFLSWSAVLIDTYWTPTGCLELCETISFVRLFMSLISSFFNGKEGTSATVLHEIQINGLNWLSSGFKLEKEMCRLYHLSITSPQICHLTFVILLLSWLTPLWGPWHKFLFSVIVSVLEKITSHLPFECSFLSWIMDKGTGQSKEKVQESGHVGDRDVNGKNKFVK